MKSEREPLPKGMSWILKTSQLVEAFEVAGIETDTYLIHGASRIYFDAFFWPISRRCSYERFYIRSSAVVKSVGPANQKYVADILIPELVVWSEANLGRGSLASRARQGESYFRREQPTL